MPKTKLLLAFTLTTIFFTTSAAQAYEAESPNYKLQWGNFESGVKESSSSGNYNVNLFNEEITINEFSTCFLCFRSPIHFTISLLNNLNQPVETEGYLTITNLISHSQSKMKIDSSEITNGKKLNLEWDTSSLIGLYQGTLEINYTQTTTLYFLYISPLALLVITLAILIVTTFYLIRRSKIKLRK